MLQCGHDPKAVENSDSGLAGRYIPWLQCGHDPKAVENARVAKLYADGYFELQCGHNPKAVENGPAGDRRVSAEVASMRPQPEGRGEPVGSVFASVGAGAASMRPQPEGRGELRAAQIQSSEMRASMRPRPEGRGERRRQPCGTATPTCFNAATTRRPWRTLARRSERNCERGFNAATTRRPWRTTTAQWQACRDYGASMRPRPEGRGEPSVSSSGTRSKGRFNAATTRRPWRTAGGRVGRLDSIRRRFNAATTRRPWRTKTFGKLSGPARVLLQCGHNPKAVENSGEDPSWTALGGASMRPRPEGRGEQATPAHGEPRGRRASMRPQPEGRGERKSGSSSAVSLFVLQCGHDPKAVENYLPHTHKTEHRGRLQCGHDPKAVENGRGGSGSRCRPASASMRPRPEGRGERAGGGNRTPRPAAALQCGHDPKAVENFLSESPASFKLAGFNAATTRRPWRTSPRRPGPRRGNEASMRPRPEGRGEPRGAQRYPAAAQASMRPRPEGRGEPPAPGCAAASNAGCFNAATTRRPWRTRKHASGRRERQGASMRPRPEGRGERAPPSPRRGLCPSLQCGHDPKAVENLEALEQVGPGFGGLQCGHDPKAVENDTTQVTSDKNYRLQCGHDPKAVENPSGKGRCRRLTHSFNAATTRRPWRTRFGGKATPTVFELQCGHDPKAVENRLGQRLSRAWTGNGFNAATTRRPWRTADEEASETLATWLQCGHNPKAVENSAPRPRPRTTEAASMRPRPEGRGEPPSTRQPSRRRRCASMRPRPEGRGEPAGRRPRRSSRTCFNAATTRRPWRTPPVLQYRGTDGTLQCGHDPKAVENGWPWQWRASSAAASMRPRPEGRGEQPSLTGSGRADKSFNAATTRRPWRTARGVPPNDAVGQHRFNAATTRRPWRTAINPLSVLRAAHGFNAATTRRPWRTTRRQQVARGVPRFNAATTRRPWRTPAASRRLHAAGRASMRPRPEGRGERRYCWTPSSRTSCFNAATTRRPWRTCSKNSR